MSMAEYVLGLAILPPDEQAAQRALARWNSRAKPIGALGLFEDMVVKIAALTGDEHVDISKRCAVVLCADNGVTKLLLDVRESNSGAVRFYEELGFTRDGRRKNYYSNPTEHAILMSMELGQ